MKDRRMMWGMVAVATIIVVCAALIACGVLLFATSKAVPRVLGGGPDGIDLRPTPRIVEPEVTLPLELNGYMRGECRSVESFHGVPLGPDAVQTVYEASSGSAYVVAARMGTYLDAAQTVEKFVEELDKGSHLSSWRLQAGEPYESWISPAGKRNFAYYYAPGWDKDRYGFIWQSGQWCFIVASNYPVARRDVSLAFPY